MTHRSLRKANRTGAAKAALTAVLCVSLAMPSAVFAAATESAPPHIIPPLTQQQRVLHALNRLTFGPRPGDEAAVTRMGLENWFQLQLHPERIDDAALDQRLDAFPAMRLSEAELVRSFPPPQTIRNLIKQGGGMPSDPVEHAIYADAVANYEAQKKKEETAPAAAGGTAMTPADAPQKAGEAALAGDDSMSASMDKPMDGQTAPAMANSTPNPLNPLNGKGKKKRAQPMDASDVDAVLSLPPDQRFAKLVSFSPEEEREFQSALRGGQRLQLVQGFTPQQIEAVAAMQGPARVVGAEALESRLLRDIYSQRQLQAVMTDFWLNHFNVYLRKSQNEPYLLPAYQRDTILPNSMGKFEDLLVATAQSPAMLMYLDNWESIGPDSLAATRVKKVQQLRPNGKIAQNLPKGINENYARELMELHTLGVNGGYTQKDVIEVAKCFTGWTIDRPYQVGMGSQGGFVYEPNRHEPGDKVVLGHTIKDGGMNEGLEVLHILATSPATAHFIANKLAVRFVSDTPSPALVDAMAATFLETDGDIKDVLTTMFRSPEFWSPQVYRAKVKTPLEFLTSAVRASDAEVKNPLPLVQAMEKLGMPIYGMQTPNGYSWLADGWVSSNALISRMNFSLVLSGDRLPGTKTNWPALLGDTESTSVATSPSPATEKQLEALLLGQPAAAHTRETVLAQFNNPTAQLQAEQNFNAQPAMADSDAQEMAGGKQGAGILRVGGRKGGGRGDLQLNQPETPLDTMAGLLLGSPDFQRR
jgi:uncharacterized protein (DUF1800 family)